ncbi:NUDIX hydrolase [Dyella terrae]|uniref:NUDIX hydrolase n=1 Tax=Dyella terrae TaxID=522259 RepID=UPI001EFC79AB|nr:NUDIX domain-containing protein [Dyella terrae]ULU27542.1 NUDIX domain-containing protein [Dyella terrae]
MSGQIIRIVAAVIRDEQGRVLMVRKRGAAVWQQPGGKRDADDHDDLHTLARELHEELGCVMRREGARWLGRFSAPAANELGHVVEAEVYEVAADGLFVARAEIEAVCWVDPVTPGDLLIAQLSRESILPLVAGA